MPIFAVLIEGLDVFLTVEVRSWAGLRRRRDTRRHGFFTTRFVEAATVEEATEKATELVSDEVRAICVNQPNMPFRTRVERIAEVEAVSGQDTLGDGFTWYDQED